MEVLMGTRLMSRLASILALAVIVAASMGAQEFKPRAIRKAGVCAASVLAGDVELIDTTWIINYVVENAESKSDQSYGTVTLRQCGKAVFDNGETGTWRVADDHVLIQNAIESNSVRRVDVVFRDDTAHGVADLGRPRPEPYRVRLVKQPVGPAEARVYWSNASSEPKCSLQCLRRRDDIGYAGCQVTSYYAASIGRCRCTLSHECNRPSVATEGATKTTGRKD
jgi:hypothetical protein